MYVVLTFNKLQLPLLLSWNMSPSLIYLFLIVFEKQYSTSVFG